MIATRNKKLTALSVQKDHEHKDRDPHLDYFKFKLESITVARVMQTDRRRRKDRARVVTRSNDETEPSVHQVQFVIRRSGRFVQHENESSKRSLNDEPTSLCFGAKAPPLSLTADTPSRERTLEGGGASALQTATFM